MVDAALAEELARIHALAIRGARPWRNDLKR
jgi:hypothetical protein